MQCPLCQSSNLRVADTRAVTGAIARRRECKSCKHRFTTLEAPDGEGAPDPVPASARKYFREKMTLTRAAALGLLALDRLGDDPDFGGEFREARQVLAAAVVNRKLPDWVTRAVPIQQSNAGMLGHSESGR